MILLRQRRIAQPLAPGGIDAGNPLCAGLLALPNVATLFDHARGVNALSAGARVNAGPYLGASDAANGPVFPALPASSYAKFSMAIVGHTRALAAVSVAGNSYMIIGGQTAFSNPAFTGGTSVRSLDYYSPNFSGQSQLDAASAFAAGKPFCIVATMNSAGNLTVYINGKQAAQQAATAATNVNQDAVGTIKIANAASAPQLSGVVAIAPLWGRELSAAEVAAFSANPFGLFAPPTSRRIFIGASSGGTAYTADQAEALTPAEASSAVAVYLSAMSEAATLADAAIATAAYSSAQAESMTLADASAAVMAALAAMVESLTATDSASGGATAYSAAQTEAPTLTESVSSALAMLAAVQESVTATAAASALASYLASAAEAINAADLVSARAGFSAAQVEATVLADVASLLAILAGTPGYLAVLSGRQWISQLSGRVWTAVEGD